MYHIWILTSRSWQLIRHGSSCLWSKHSGRLRWVDHLRSGVWDQPGQHGKTPTLLKVQKFSRAWWDAPVIPATWEAEERESLEPGRQRLQWAKTVPLHSSLGDRAKFHLKKQKKDQFRCFWKLTTKENDYTHRFPPPNQLIPHKSPVTQP